MSGLQAGSTAARPTYRLIQALRALAAIMVVMHHATQALHDRYHVAIREWPNGASGVDIFFVISGFVMTVSSQPLIASPHPMRTFLTRRLERIVPLYWLLTLAKVLIIRLHPSASLNGLGSTWYIAASFLFIPAYSKANALEPVLIVGWTLNLEIFFYLAFAFALAMRVPPAKVVLPVLSLIVLLGLLPFMPAAGSMAWLAYRDPIVLEFTFGVLLATMLPQARKLPSSAALAGSLVGLSCLLAWAWPRASYWRFVGWGLPALAIVWGAVALEHRWGKHVPALILELGNSSYSLYLVHGFTLPILSGALVFWLTQRPGGVTFVSLALLLLAIASGELLYHGVERPIMQWFLARRRAAVPVNASP